MQIVTAHNGVLRTLRREPVGFGMPVGDDSDRGTSTAGTKTWFQTGLPLLDALAPSRALGFGAVHELLFPPNTQPPQFVAMLLAGAAARARAGSIIWSDPDQTFYPPALAFMGLSLEKLLILRPAAPADELWAAAECLRCKSVSATILQANRLHRVQARRLQLAAESGGGAGFFLRPLRSAEEYAAATRWLVEPAPGDQNLQRWKVELLHGHGGQVGKPVFLEARRDMNFSGTARWQVRAVEPQKHRATTRRPVISA